MNSIDKKQTEYSIFDPTGNITALVESEAEISRQPELAAGIMKRHSEVEQVGFVRLLKDRTDVQAALRMAGGEFCGNASMCAAVWYCLQQEQEDPESMNVLNSPDQEIEVALSVSGASQPVAVRLKKGFGNEFYTGIRMPRALEIENRTFELDGYSDDLPVVRMEGISHIMIRPESGFFRLKEKRDQAGKAVRAWCGALAADGLGLMFLEKAEQEYGLTPLVYIPGSNTEFWENSCASGSAAAGMYLSAEKEGKVKTVFREPGGVLMVQSDYQGGETWLYGRVRFGERLSCTCI